MLTLPIESPCGQDETDIAYDEAGNGKSDALTINGEKWRQTYSTDTVMVTNIAMVKFAVPVEARSFMARGRAGWNAYCCSNL